MNDIKNGNKFMCYEEWNFVCMLSFKKVVIH